MSSSQAGGYLKFSKKTLKAVIIQTAFLALVFGGLYYLFSNAIAALEAQGLTTGFGFLDRARGWAFPVGIYTAPDRASYIETLWQATKNTLLVGGCAIVLATIFGFLIGVAQTSTNTLLRGFSRLFVTIFRNIPTMIYVVFIFSAMLTLPAPRGAENFLGMFYFSNRGIFTPHLVMSSWLWAMMAICLLAPMLSMVMLRKINVYLKLGQLISLQIAGCVLAVIIAGISIKLGYAEFDLPEKAAFDFKGGARLPIEFITLLLAVTIFGTSYIAEIVRGALLSVPKGMTEAASALGLKPAHQFFDVRLPIALRSMIPAVSNQYLYMMKGTALGAVIGYGDLFAVSNLSINYSGQTLEILAIMMGIFIVINFSMSKVLNFINQRLQFKRNGS